jgi:sulfur-oxidizing protein SoxZ
MASPMRIRATEKDGVIDVRILMKHDMETGQRKTPEGTTIPAWFISTVEAKIGDRIVYSAQFGPAVSKDPFLHFKLKATAKKGDIITITWIDNKGDTQTDKSDIK